MGDESYLNEKRMNEENNANLQVQNETDNKEVTKLEGVADSFRGLPMRELISAPLIAVSEAQQQLATSTLGGKDASTSKSEEDTELTTDVTSKWFGTSVSVQGKVGASKANTRSTSQTAKYQVSVSASQQGQPEALSKLMDMMACGIEPLENK